MATVFTDIHPVAHAFLDETIRFFEDQAMTQRLNELCIKQLIMISRLMQRTDITQRLIALWENVLLKTPKPSEANAPLESLRSAFRDYPLGSPPPMVPLYQKASPHILASSEGAYDSALRLAETDLEREEVIMTQVILGDFERALTTFQRLQVPRAITKELLLLTCIVEYFRRDNIEQTQRLLRQFREEQPSDWNYVHLLRGFLYVEPWSGYPYADY